MIERHYSVKDVSTLLGFSRQWVRDEFKAGRLAPAVLIAGELRFSESTLKAFLAAREVQPAAFFENQQDFKAEVAAP